jgi:hypothetical protein
MHCPVFLECHAQLRKVTLGALDFLLLDDPGVGRQADGGKQAHYGHRRHQFQQGEGSRLPGFERNPPQRSWMVKWRVRGHRCKNSGIAA